MRESWARNRQKSKTSTFRGVNTGLELEAMVAVGARLAVQSQRQVCSTVEKQHCEASFFNEGSPA